MSLTCPQCASARLYVVETSSSDEGLRRRRKCKQCDTTFTTVEKIQTERADTVEVPRETYDAFNELVRNIEKNRRLRSWSQYGNTTRK